LYFCQTFSKIVLSCGDVAACLETACVLFVVQNAVYTTNSTHVISRQAATSPHNNTILLNVLTEIQL